MVILLCWRGMTTMRAAAPRYGLFEGEADVSGTSHRTGTAVFDRKQTMPFCCDSLPSVDDAALHKRPFLADDRLHHRLHALPEDRGSDQQERPM
jgi:hypothetical protein